MHLFLMSLLACGPADEPADSAGDDTRDTTVDEGTGDPTGGETATTPDDDWSPELPGDYEYEGEQGTEGDFDKALVEAALADFVGGILAITPEPALAGYESLLDDGDARCPCWYEQDGNTFWYADCEADSGATFDGYGFYNLYEDDMTVFGDGRAWDLVQVSGAATMRDAAGHTFHLGGDLYQGTGAGVGNDTSVSWVSGVIGSLAWDGESADDTWLDAGVTPSLFAYGISYPQGPLDAANYVMLDGTVGNMSDAATAVEFSEFSVIDELFGNPCEQEAIGAIAVRDVDGVWWDVMFDVETNDQGGWDLVGECDGCGAVFKGTELVGEACVDVSTLLDWETKPW